MHGNQSLYTRMIIFLHFVKQGERLNFICIYVKLSLILMTRLHIEVFIYIYDIILTTITSLLVGLK